MICGIAAFMEELHSNHDWNSFLCLWEFGDGKDLQIDQSP
jgi:hypothetical protein